MDQPGKGATKCGSFLSTAALMLHKLFPFPLFLCSYILIFCLPLSSIPLSLSLPLSPSLSLSLPLPPSPSLSLAAESQDFKGFYASSRVSPPTVLMKGGERREGGKEEGKEQHYHIRCIWSISSTNITASVHHPHLQWSLRTMDTLGAGLLSVVEGCPYLGG